MSDLGKPPRSAFWDFTLSIYSRDGVSPALITLQDRLGLDVNFLLYCLFAGARGHALGSEDLTRLEAVAAPLRKNLIHPLRQVRRWLKEQTAVAKESADAIRRAVLAQEIESEGQQQRAMEALLTLPEGTPDLATATGNLAKYLAWSNVAAGPAEVGLLATVLAQAFASSAEGAKWGLHAAFAKTAAPQKFS